MISIEHLDIEALIDQRLQTRKYVSVEQVLLQALTDAPLPASPKFGSPGATGADIIAAFQKCPVKDWDFEPTRWWVQWDKPEGSE